MIRHTAVVLLGILAVLLPAGLAAHEGHEHKVMGTVTAVDATHLELETQEGEALSIRLTDETEYKKGKEPATAADVKVGVRAVVTMVEEEGRQTAKEVLLPES